MSDVELPYMRLWVADLMADPPVQLMDNEEFGAYMRLLCHAWREGGIPAESGELCRLLHVTPATFRRLWKRLEPLWQSNGNGRLINRRQEREREEAKRLARKRSRAGAAGARARWGDG